eukprot:jgi/Tetstr1/459661/TSEL_005017.t1
MVTAAGRTAASPDSAASGATAARVDDGAAGSRSWRSATLAGRAGAYRRTGQSGRAQLPRSDGHPSPPSRGRRGGAVERMSQWVATGRSTAPPGWWASVPSGGGAAGLTCATPGNRAIGQRVGECAPTDCSTGAPAPGGHYRGWIKRPAATRGEPMASSHTASFRNGCVVSHRYGFVYVHTLKAGGMTMKSFLKDVMCGTHLVTPQHPCRGDPQLLSVTNCHRHIRQHPGHLVFGVVRNPFARAWSAFAMASPRNVTFAQFAADPGRSMHGRTRTTAAHWEPQTSFLLTRQGCPAVDFLARIEHLEQDLARLFEVAGSPELREGVARGVWHSTETNFGKRKLEERGSAAPLRDVYASPGDDIRRGIAEYYAQDFQLLGYDPHTVPPA